MILPRSDTPFRPIRWWLDYGVVSFDRVPLAGSALVDERRARLGVSISVLLFSFSQSVFQQSVYGTRHFQLLEAPFQNDFRDIAEFSPFLLSERLQFAAQVLPDSQAELYFPFAHQVFLLSV